MLRAPVVCLVILVAVAGCGGSPPTGPTTSRPLSEAASTSALTFRYAAGDTVDAAWQQAYHEWAVQALGVTVTRRITYNKYLDRAHMGEVIGVSNTNAYADPATYAIHTIWPRDNHEVVHLYATAFGSPVALFSEGFAVAHQVNPVAGDFVPKWSGTPLHALARSFRSQGRLVAIAQLTATADFRQPDPNVTYPEAGSFVQYLIERDGLDRMKTLFSRGTAGDTAASVRTAFERTYGESLDQAEQDWLAFLDGQPSR